MEPMRGYPAGFFSHGNKMPRMITQIEVLHTPELK